MRSWSLADVLMGGLLMGSTFRTMFTSRRQLASYVTIVDESQLESSSDDTHYHHDEQETELIPHQESKTKPPHRPNQNHTNDSYPFTFSACLIARDDNILLPEWIAYHYTVLPLRHLVLAADPLGITSPLAIIQQFRRELPDLTIDLWTGNSYWAFDGRWSREKIHNFNPYNYTKQHAHIMHRQRQRVFYTQCLQHLKNHSSTSWTVLIDTDEYFTYNTPLPSEHGKHDYLFRDQLPKRIGHQNETIAHWIDSHIIQQSNNNSNNNNTNTSSVVKNTTICLVQPRLFFSAKDGITNSEIVRLHQQQSTTKAVLRMERFHSLRFRSHGPTERALPGKSIVQLKNFPLHKRVDNPHSPFPKACDTPAFQSVEYPNTPFRVHHYSGSLESWLSRPSRTLKGWEERNNMNIVGRDHSLAGWYERFVELVGGEQTAEKLTLEAQDLAYQEWKDIEVRVAGRPNETIPLAFNWTEPGVWEGNVL